MKLLSLYVMGGFGHLKPALALVEQFRRCTGIDGRAYDIFSADGTPNYDSANIYNFLTRSTLFLPLWNLFTRHDLLPWWLFSPVHTWEVFQNQPLIKKLAALETDTDLLVTATHWTPALLAAKAFPHKTIFLYVTDIHPHGLWKIAPTNIHYLVPMEETKIDITRYGIPQDKVTITSFPIHSEIINGNHQRHLRRLQNLKQKDPKTIDILTISGGAGTGKAELLRLLQSFLVPAKGGRVRLTILVSTPQLHIDLVSFCAKNQTAKTQVFIDRYTPQTLYPALLKAEVLITKAGGDVTFEALAEGLPIYSLKDVGDHERLNRQYLELIGASKPLFYAKEPWHLIQSDIFSGEIILMTKNSHKHGDFHRRCSTSKIIWQLLKNRRRSLTSQPLPVAP